MDYMTNKKRTGKFFSPVLSIFVKSRRSKIKDKLYVEFLKAQDEKDFNKAGILAKRILEL